MLVFDSKSHGYNRTNTIHEISKRAKYMHNSSENRLSRGQTLSDIRWRLQNRTFHIIKLFVNSDPTDICKSCFYFDMLYNWHECCRLTVSIALNKCIRTCTRFVRKIKGGSLCLASTYVFFCLFIFHIHIHISVCLHNSTYWLILIIQNN